MVLTQLFTSPAAASQTANNISCTPAHEGVLGKRASGSGSSSRGEEQLHAREISAGAQAADLRSARRHGGPQQAQLHRAAQKAVLTAAGHSVERHDVWVAVWHSPGQSTIRAIAKQALITAKTRPS